MNNYGVQYVGVFGNKNFIKLFSTKTLAEKYAAKENKKLSIVIKKLGAKFVVKELSKSNKKTANRKDISLFEKISLINDTY